MPKNYPINSIGLGNLFLNLISQYSVIYNFKLISKLLNLFLVKRDEIGNMKL